MKAAIFLRHETIPLPVPRPDFIDRARRLLPEFEWSECADEKTFLAQLPRADAVLVWRFDAAWRGLAEKLRWIATPAAGAELIGVQPDDRLVVSHGAFHGVLMSETVLALMLAFVRGIKAGFDLRDDPWPRARLTEIARPLAGSTALILGFGHIGKWIGRRLKALDVRLVGVNRTDLARPDYMESGDSVVPADELDRWLPEADHAILVLPSGRGTDKIMDARRLALLKAGAYLYNVGRGNAVDEEALAEALRSGRLAGAGLDVFEREPLPADSPLRRCPNAILLPHVSAMAPNYLDLFLDEFAASARERMAAPRG
ncbi:MAG: D-2-hydroxyacid dehydrogenase [Planctomycetota bacterium]|jgi:phosphoglycerate dehydrogenase-like enzyme|nr:D-2-hydroxyacid dehydrogenase [Planctomycetota bacterium]